MNTTPPAAPCGIICADCAIFQAAQDPAAAVRLATAWRENGFANAVPEWFRCQGCRGDRSLCWSDDCRIYACCVEERKLSSCAECGDFPCPALTAWAADAGHHAAALERLKETRAQR